MAESAPWWPSLDTHLLRQWAKPDCVSSLLATTIHLMRAFRAHSYSECASDLLPVVLEATLLWVTLTARRQTLATLRPVLVVAIRLCVLLLVPFAVDVVASSSAGGAGSSGGGARSGLADAGAHLRAIAMLLVPVSWCALGLCGGGMATRV